MSPKGIRLTAAQLLARQVSEEQHMNDVMERLALAGFSLIYHVPDSRRVTSAGFPDVIACGAGRLLAIECKKVGGVVSPAQRAWLDDLGKVPGVEALVTTPEDWTTLESLLPMPGRTDGVESTSRRNSTARRLDRMFKGRGPIQRSLVAIHLIHEARTALADAEDYLRFPDRSTFPRARVFLALAEANCLAAAQELTESETVADTGGSDEPAGGTGLHP